MALNRYDSQVTIDGDRYYYRLSNKELPQDSSKYIMTKWSNDYTWHRLSYLVYGDTELYWILLKANNILDPTSIKPGDQVRILKQEYLNEVKR